MPRRSLPARLSRLILIVAATAAVLVAAALPASALADWALRNAAVAYDDLPEVLRNPTTAQASYLYANDGRTLITTFYDENRRDVRLDQVAQVVRDAIVAAEDTRFYSHNGVDVKGVLRAVVANGASGEVEQGASTLTMQYVRNVLKSDPTLTEQERAAATEQSAGRKIREARYAMALDERLSKDEILERYLNIAYFGAGAYGIWAASHTYFAKSPDKLTLAEAALLAGLLQQPEADNPIDGDTERALARRSYVLNSMVGMDAVTADEAAAAQGSELKLKRGANPNNCTAARKSYGFFCDYLRQWWNQQAAFGDSVAERELALRQGGYRVITSLDPDLQAAAQEQVLDVYGYSNKRTLPMAVVEPGSGRVLAMAVNRKYSLKKGTANTVNQLIAGGGSIDGYQAGSTFKMFTMLAALEAGMPLDTGFNAPTRLQTQWPESGEVSCNGYWCPSNANPSWMNGYRTMWTGFGRSVNTYFVWLEQQVGADKVVEMAQRLGIRFRQDADAERDPAAWGSFTLGTAQTTPLDLANAYATLAADGQYCAPLPVTSVTGSDGQPVGVAEPACTQAVSVDVARAATDAARCPVGQQGAFYRCNGATAGAVSQLLGGRPVAGKTGSTDRNTTETFVAFTPQLAAAAIAANPTDTRDAVGAAVLSGVYRAVANTLSAGSQDLPARQFGKPSATITYRLGYSVPDPTPSPKPSTSPSGSPSATASPDPAGNDHGGNRSGNGLGGLLDGLTGNRD